MRPGGPPRSPSLSFLITYDDWKITIAREGVSAAVVTFTLPHWVAVMAAWCFGAFGARFRASVERAICYGC